MILNVNTDAAVKFTNQLEKLRKFDLPIAIRTALNDAAFDVKMKTMPKAADATFKKRQPNFFKANSKVDSAKGFDVNKMVSTVGFFENKLANQSANWAVKDLEEQEKGGEIDSKSFIAMKPARSSRGTIKPNARLKELRENAINATKGKYGKKQNYIRAAFVAQKLGKFVLGNKWKGSQTLSRVDEIWGSTQKQGGFGSRKLMIKRTALYTFKKGRTVHVAGTNFMQRASYESGLKLELFYIKNAEKRIAKFNA